MTRLILARHGTTDWNQERRYHGHRDVPLSEEGRRQAELLGARLAAEPISHAYTSDLGRSVETAAIALRGRSVPITASPELREISFGAWEGLRYDEVSSAFPEDWARWCEDPANACPTGGPETYTQLQERVVRFYRSAVKPREPDHEGRPQAWHGWAPITPSSEGALLLVTHGGWIGALLVHLLGMPVDLYWRFRIRPASVSIFEVYPEGPIAEVIGDTSYLDGLGR